MPQCRSPGAAPESGPPAEGAVASPDPGDAAALLERLMAVEAGIRDDRRRLPAAVVEEIASLLAAGATVPDVAARTRVSSGLVRDRLRRAGALECLNWNRHVPEMLESRAAELAAAYEAGATITALAADAGVGRRTLSKFLSPRAYGSATIAGGTGGGG